MKTYTSSSLMIMMCMSSDPKIEKREREENRREKLVVHKAEAN